MGNDWTCPSDLNEQLDRAWQRGVLLSSLISGESSFPLRLRLKTPSSRDLSDRFDEVRKWIGDIRSLANYRIEMREIKHRALGKNAIPESVWVDTIDDAAVIIGRETELEQFKSVVAITHEELPEAFGWLQKKPMLALVYATDWLSLLRVVKWMRSNPRPGVYAREVSIAGVHSKFIDEHRGILSELLDEILPPASIDLRAAGVSQFNARYGFKDKPIRIRFRLLDEPEKDRTLDSLSFADLDCPARRVFIVENEINFLAFPQVPDSMVIFGAGYGFEALARATWLFHCAVYYWGDIDTHGFAILNSLRKYFPHVNSLLMDESTLLRFSALAGKEYEPTKGDYLNFLTVPEAAVYAGLKRDAWSENFRLEQERIDWSYALDSISSTVALELESSSPPVILSSQDISNYLLPSKCELRVYLAASGLLPDQPNGPAMPLRKERERFLRQYLNGLGPHVCDLSSTPRNSRGQFTLEAIARREMIIYKPGLCRDFRLAGRNVEIYADADFLILDGEEYIVRDLSLAQKINEENNLHLRLRLQLFSALLRKLVPGLSHRLDAMIDFGKCLSQPDDRGLCALTLLVEILKAKTSSTAPYSPVSWSKCRGCMFHKHCFDKAREFEDVALLPSVNQDLAKQLHSVGAGNISTLLSKFDESSLSDLIARRTTRADDSIKVGSTAQSVLRNARVVKDNSCFWLAKSRLNELQSFERHVILDCEGLPRYLPYDEFVYIWGTKLFGKEEEKPYIAAIAVDRESDKLAWEQFLKNFQIIFEAHGDIPIFHWHHYERTMLRLYVERYGDPSGFAERVEKNLVDLFTVLRESVIMPVESYGLKTIESFIGYKRKLANRDGSWAIEMYIDALSEISREGRNLLITELLSYNEEDLNGTEAVLQWLLKEAVSRECDPGAN